MIYYGAIGNLLVAVLVAALLTLGIIAYIFDCPDLFMGENLRDMPTCDLIPPALFMLFMFFLTSWSSWRYFSVLKKMKYASQQ
jgi:hypothetical protein